MNKGSWWDTAFALFGRAVLGGVFGGLLMIVYAMLDARAHRVDAWVPLRAIGATFLGDRGVDDPSFKVEGVILGAIVHATNSIIFALILALIVAAVLGGLPLSRLAQAALTVVGGVLYALTLMVVMQNVVVPIADPSFSEYNTSEGQFIVEHVLYGLAVSALLITAWRSSPLSVPSRGGLPLQQS